MLCASYFRVTTLLICLVSFGSLQTSLAALRFLKSEPNYFDFADQRALPPTFGSGEFTLELWIKPDASFPVGYTDRGTLNQLSAWSNADPAPYSAGNWWFAGNFLLDGHTRPNGFTPDKTREGTFSLQFYGGGRLRWMFADDGEVAPVGKVWAVEAYPASSTPSLLDGKWHNVNCVRRWVGISKAQLELWIDGRLIATQVIPMRVNMRQFWDALPHPRNPKTVGGWCWGSEVMTAWNQYFTQYEDYKGLLAEVRFWDRAKPAQEIQTNWMKAVSAKETGLVGYFPLDENTGTVARDKLDSTRTMTLHNSQTESWSTERPFDRE
jgi:concanavalin A-like lectin/glucanase superfamily protein